MKNNIPHIVQYQGSKRLLAPQILQYFPNKFNRLIEPFAGMAAITIATANQRRTSNYLINDINTPLIDLLQCAIETPSLLYDNYKSLWEEQFSYISGNIGHYYHVRERFNNGDRNPEVMLYLLARCVKGAVRYSRDGKFNQSPDKRRHGTNPRTLLENITSISNLLKGKVEYTSSDYREVLEVARRGDLVYMDPPYQGVSNTKDSRYFSGIDFNTFVETLETLNRRDVNFIISYDGKCGDKKYGNDLPKWLDCQQIYLNAGLSSQSVLLGKKDITYESLYLSRNIRNAQLYTQSSIFDSVAI